MKTRPIIFDAESVRAILAGNKTQTRRVVKPQPEFIDSSTRWCWPLPARARFKGCCTEVVTASREWWEYAPKEAFPYAPGDELWVREKWAVEDASKLKLREFEGGGNPDWIYYRDPVHIGTGLSWRSPIHMPRWASRLTLRVTDVRVERVQEISEADAIAEGVDYMPSTPASMTHRGAFSKRWESINAKRGFSWGLNPWVWVVTFERIDL